MKRTQRSTLLLIILCLTSNTLWSAGPFQQVWSQQSSDSCIEKSVVPQPPSYANSVEKSIESPPNPLHMGAIYLAWLNHERNLKEVAHTSAPNDVLCDQMGLDSSVFPNDAQFGLTEEQLQQVKKKEERLLSVAQFNPEVKEVIEKVVEKGKYVDKCEQVLSIQPQTKQDYLKNLRREMINSNNENLNLKRIGSLHGFLATRGLDRVTVLDLQHQRLTNFPVEVGAALPVVRRVSLGHNQLSEPPLAALQAMPCLEEVELSQNPFHTLKRDAVTCLQRLKILKLFNCGPLAELDNACIRDLPELTTVDLSCNALGSLQLDYPTLGKLEKVAVMYNELCYPPNYSFWMDDFTPSVTSLDLHGNQITLRKEIFSNFPLLTELSLSFNRNIDVIPENVFSNLTKLTHLRIGDCKIHTIEPGALNGLCSLKEFDFWGNDYKHLTAGVFGWGLDNLEKIEFRQNSLIKIDRIALQQLGQLSKLKLVSFGGSAKHVRDEIKKVLPKECTFRE